MKKVILILLITMVFVSLYSNRVTEGMIRLINYDVLHADILGLRNDNLYILTRSDEQRELIILQRDDVQGVFRRGSGNRLRREVTSMVFYEPDWFNFSISDHIDGFTWYNTEVSYNEAHIEILALITTFAFNNNRLTGVRTFNSLHRQLRTLDLTNAHNAELINMRTSIAQGVAVQDLLTQHQTPAHSDIPVLPFFTPVAEETSPREEITLNEDIIIATQNAVNNIVSSIPTGVTIAVITVKSEENDVMSELISYEVQNYLSDTGNFRMIDLQVIYTFQVERDFQFVGLSDINALESGRAFGADIVVISEFIRTGRSETLTLRALSVETGENVGMARERVN